MKDEIKEIIDRLERIDHKEYSGGFEFADSGTFDEMARCFDERKKLVDYITNLQKENKQLKENKKELIEFLKEYDKYRDSFKWNEQDYIDTIEKIKELLGDKEQDIELDVLKALNTDLDDDVEMG